MTALAARAPMPATYDDLLALPEHLIGEIIDGDLIASPRPAPAHAAATSSVGSALHAPYHRRSGDPNGPGGWWILDEPELHLGRHVLVPDLAGWRRERLPALPETAYFALPPDWVCEVVSPGSVRRDRVQKMRIYGEFGVAWLWLVVPEQQLVEVFERQGDRWLLAGTAVGDEAEARLPPFDAVPLDLARWWDVGDPL